MRLLQALRVGSTDDTPRPGGFDVIVAAVSEYLGWDLGHAYVYVASADRLTPTNRWYERQPGAHASLIEESSGVLLGPREGLPGRALAARSPVWIEDLDADPDFIRGGSARSAGVRSGVAVPVFVNGSVASVLEFFSEERREADQDTLDVLGFVGVAWSRILECEHLGTELTHKDERLRALVRSAADAIIVADAQGYVREWNPAATRMFGYEPAEIIGKPLTTIMPPSYRTRHVVAFNRAVERPKERVASSSVLELEGLTKDGRVFPIELSLASWTAGQRYFAGIMRDISERRAAEEELNLLVSAAGHVRDAIVVSTGGESGRGPSILYVNRAFTRMTGYSEAEVLGRSFGLLAGPATDDDMLHTMQERFRRGEPSAVELTAYRADGGEFLLEWHASPIYEADGSVRHFASILRDITEERRVEQALRRADRDPLTGLPNREILEKRLSRSLERVKERDDYRFAVLFMDLDGFKAVNDEHGHVAGDQLLKSAARRLERTVRPGDTLARFGGDEFVVLLDYISGISDVVMVANRVQERLSAPFDIQGEQLSIAASVGIALSESGYDDAKDVIRDADSAMYEAKRKGKGRVEFHDRAIYGDIVSVLGLQEDLRRAVEKDELELHYQPLVDLPTREIIGVEALVRWRHPELGLLPPERFVSMAEETGHIVPMGRWILEEACRTAGSWKSSGPEGRDLILSVNLSVRELTRPDLVENVRDTLERTGFDPRRLQLELTESVLVETLEPVRSHLTELRRLGITVCIDDFGTGYSSLGYLHRFPIDKIKIDRLFVRDLEETPGNLEILRTILMLASNLGLDVVAEGVETLAQLTHLQELACGYGQGFLFSRPLRPEQVEELLAGGVTTSGSSEPTRQDPAG